MKTKTWEKMTTLEQTPEEYEIKPTEDEQQPEEDRNQISP